MKNLKGKQAPRLFRATALAVIITFLTQLIYTPQAYAQIQTNFYLPSPGVMVAPSEGFTPIVLRGLKVDTQNPFNFDFIVNWFNGLCARRKEVFK